MFTLFCFVCVCVCVCVCSGYTVAADDRISSRFGFTFFLWNWMALSLSHMPVWWKSRWEKVRETFLFFFSEPLWLSKLGKAQQNVQWLEKSSYNCSLEISKWVWELKNRAWLPPIDRQKHEKRCLFVHVSFPRVLAPHEGRMQRSSWTVL